MTTNNVQPASEISSADRGLSAVMIASGVGATVLGLAIILAELSQGIRSAFILNSGVGPLSGKTSLATLAFVVSWAVLHYVFKTRPISINRAFVITVVLLVVGLLLSFPPVFLAFEA